MFNGAILFNNNDQPLITREVTREDNTTYTAWNTSSVTDMRSMFEDAISFNQDISNWNVSNVEDMSYMFYKARSFNQDISNWDVSNVGRYELYVF